MNPCAVHKVYMFNNSHIGFTLNFVYIMHGSLTVGTWHFKGKLSIVYGVINSGVNLPHNLLMRRDMRKF